jgi:hypothetical protein
MIDAHYEALRLSRIIHFTHLYSPTQNLRFNSGTAFWSRRELKRCLALYGSSGLYLIFLMGPGGISHLISGSGIKQLSRNSV